MSNKQPSESGFNATREFTREETERLNRILNKQLGPEYISKRPSGGGPVSYIEGWKALNLANHVFGFNGWNSEIRSTSVDYVDDHGGNGRYSVGLSVVIRITLKDGTYHEDIGYGCIDNAKGRAAAFEKCKKQAITDGMKRCLRCFGNVLGNCLYDKDFLRYIGKAKTIPPKFNEDDLLRHPDVVKTNQLKPIENNDFTMPKKEPSPVQRSNETPTSANHNEKKRISSHTRKLSNEAVPAVKNDMLTESMFDDSLEEHFDDENEFNDIDAYDLALIDANVDDNGSGNAYSREPLPTGNTPSSSDNKTASVPSNVSFFSAKAAVEVQSNAAIPPDKQFNLNYHSPSLKKTIDHSKSIPVKRTGLQQRPVYPKSSQHAGHLKRQSLVPLPGNEVAPKQRRILENSS